MRTTSYETAGTFDNPYNPKPRNQFNKFDNLAQPPNMQGPVNPFDGYEYIKDKIDVPAPVQYNPVANQFANQRPQQIQGLGQDFFQQERDRRRDDLRKEFFGPQGVLSQASYGESAAGRLGSGVGKRVLENTVSNPFAQAFTGIDRDVGQQQMQEQARVQELNSQIQNDYTKFLGNLSQTDSSNALNASIANKEIETQINELAARMSTDWAKNLNDYELKAYENYIDLLREQLAHNQWVEEEARRQRELGWQMNK
jgi:hypothetical protein